MTDEEIIEMAKEAKLPHYWETGDIVCFDEVRHFAKLVAAHTLMNIDPSKFIGGYREGFEAGVAKEREACAKLFDNRDNGIGFYEPHEPAEIIRARGQA